MLPALRLKCGNVLVTKEANIPWDGQGLGGELSRDAISKERWIRECVLSFEIVNMFFK